MSARAVCSCLTCFLRQIRGQSVFVICIPYCSALPPAGHFLAAGQESNQRSRLRGGFEFCALRLAKSRASPGCTPRALPSLRSGRSLHAPAGATASKATSPKNPTRRALGQCCARQWIVFSSSKSQIPIYRAVPVEQAQRMVDNCQGS